MYSDQRQHELLALTAELLKIKTPPAQKEAAKKLIEDLTTAINFHDWRYYVQADPVVTDFDYDMLFKLLRQTEEKFPDLLCADSPTQRVAYGLTKEFPSVAHLVPMLSLDNSYNEEDLEEFDKRVKNLTEAENIDYSVEPKFDGASIALIYENDKLVRGATRGDGVMGEEITNNLKILKSLPLTASFSKYGIYKAELRGEVIIRKDKFQAYNERRMEEGLSVLANPRNTASGALRMQNSAEVAGRGLEGFIYHLAYAEDKDGNKILKSLIKTHSRSLEILFELGFKSPEKEKRIFSNIKDVVKYCDEWQQKRDSYPYEIDGMVIKVNEYRLQELAGATSHHPRWAMAYKFKARQATTRLNDIWFSVGRTGAITPIARVQPVQLAGVTISNISLFNEDVMHEKDVRVGDMVLVERAGDVIPYIVGPVLEMRKTELPITNFPKNCPACNSELVKIEGEAVIRCVNANCAPQVAGRIIHFVSKDAMDIRGLGHSLVYRFIEAGLVKSIPDIYRLDYDRILAMEGFKQKSVNNLRNAIETSKNQPMYRVIYGLGIKYVGEITAKTLASNISHVLDLQNKTVEQLQEMQDIGPKVGSAVAEFFSNEQNIDIVKQLEELGVNVKAGKETSKKVSNKFEGKTFLFTGTLEKMTRDEAESMVEANGGKIVSSVSSKLNYLVVGSSPGSKLAKAEKIGSIEIIGEEKFLELLK